MAIPANLIEWGARLDPSDLDRYYADLVDPAGPPLLEIDETVASFTVSLQLESSALGLEIASGPRAPKLVDADRKIEVWLTVAEEMRGNPAFDGNGIALPVTFTVDVLLADGAEATRQRSLLVRVVQQ